MTFLAKKSQKISCKTVIRKTYFALFCEFAFNLLSNIVDEFRLELLERRHATDVWKMYQGGITQAVKCYAKANKKYVKDQYILYETSTYLQYLDPNNLYGWVMVTNLSTYGFAWGKFHDFTPEKWQTKLIDKLGFKNHDVLQRWRSTHICTKPGLLDNNKSIYYFKYSGHTSEIIIFFCKQIKLLQFYVPM